MMDLRGSARALGLLFLVASNVATCPAATITVDLSGAGDFTSIQDALDAAKDGDTVLVKPGEYLVQEPLDFNRGAVWNGTAKKDLVLRSEAGPVATVIRRPGPGGLGEGGVVVRFHSGEGPSSVLEGFTLKCGCAQIGSSPEEAGCLSCFADATIRGCVILGESCEPSGLAGIHCAGSPTLEGCRISGCPGPGVRCDEGSPSFTDCTIEASYGPGITGFDSSFVLRGCHIEGNFNAGVDAFTGCRATIEDCVISGNLGAGISCGYGADAAISRCIILGNHSTGIECDENPAPVIADCVIAGNWQAGISTDDDASPTIVRSTIAGNHRGIGLGTYGAVTVRSCVIWDNVAAAIDNYREPQEDGPIFDIAFSCVEGEAAFPGLGNINADPRFCGWGDAPEVHVDAAAAGPGDGSAAHPYPDLAPALAYSYGLAADSPCRGAGEGGSDMGADRGSCDAAGAASRRIRLASGEYSTQGSSFVHHVSLEGSGVDRTVLEGSVAGLRTGTLLSDVTVRYGWDFGIGIPDGQAPEIRRVAVLGCRYGGIQCRWESSPLIADCTIAGNGAQGVEVSSGSPRFENCILRGNQTGMWCSSASPILVHCTVAGNRVSGQGGGAGIACNESSHPVLRGCIVWGNSPQEACGSLENCLTDRDPLFVKEGQLDTSRFARREVGGLYLELPDFIIEEADLHLRPDSPAIDLAPCAGAPDHDRDGAPRPAGASCDAGAYEFQTSAPVAFIRGDSNADGRLDVSDPIHALRYLFTGGPAPTCLDAADGDDGGSVDISDGVYLLLYLFTGGKAPPPPGPSCGLDPTPDELGCAGYKACE